MPQWYWIFFLLAHWTNFGTHLFFSMVVSANSLETFQIYTIPTMDLQLSACWKNLAWSHFVLNLELLM